MSGPALFTIVVIFALQGEAILDRPFYVLRIAGTCAIDVEPAPSP